MLLQQLGAKERSERDATEERLQATAEAQSLAIRLGLYRSVLRTDVAAIVKARA